MNFKTLSPREFDIHRGTCPLEIGRFVIENGIKEELHGPLVISRIFSQIEVGNSIMIALLDGIDDAHEIPVVEGSDGILYTLKDEIYFSITKILEHPYKKDS